MRILFDQGTPAPLRHALATHEITTAFERGWQILENGDLLLAAEAAGFDAIVTTDQNLRYQQNLKNRRIAILVLSTTSWPRLRTQTDLVIQAIERLCVGGYLELDIPP